MLVIVAKVICCICILLIALIFGTFFLWGFLEAIRERNWLDIVLGLIIIMLFAVFFMGAANG